MDLLEEFQAIFRQAEGRLVGEGYYGVWEGFPFSAHIENARAPGEISFFFRVPVTLERRLFKELKREMPKGCRLLAAPNASYRLLCNGRALRRCTRSLSSVLNSLTRGLRRAGAAPSDVCPICRQGGCDAYADVSGYTAVHRSCVEAMLEDRRSKAERSLTSGSYVTGFIGALLGGLVACVPTLLAYWAGWLVGYLYMLIPLGAYYGYKLFRGKMNRGAFVSTCIVSVLHLFTIEQIIFYFYVHNYYGIWPSILDTVRLYIEKMPLPDILADMWMSALFMGLGLWFSWSAIRRTAYSDLGSANSIRSTLMNKRENPWET